ncbi:HD domain-containing phosphohydrolase [Acetobacterium woodii]|uniref:HD-GYP domain-containing protein n=1 Tax=Acetobacterium woodii (strain ATCC 29683 / DSM 1030 / JCM 2381 / KCTC 1655 / WB1) TaxID=931626 RepID=H6LF88_ACEWD|nr:HD domain-containing phosphohydrolase [Acetobacterium woodii]AFA48188.1 hypothetical protein Awo_c14040 [Acetobacterium woodii DSM 1030]
MLKETKRAYLVFVIIVMIIGLLILGLYGYALHLRTIKYTYSEDIASGSYKNNDFYVEINTGKNWEDNIKGHIGAQYDGEFYNNTNIDLINWTIEFAVPEESVIDSSWNGVYQKKGNHILVTAVDYNTIISKIKPETFGLVMVSDDLFYVNEITVSGYKDYKLTDFLFFWVLMIVFLVVIIIFLSSLIFELQMKRMYLKQEEYKNIIMQSLRTFANIIDTKDSYTKGHSYRVAKYAQEISRRMGKSQEEQTRIFQISMLHDIGKIAIDNSILDKPGKLTLAEHLEIQKHTSTGGDILKDFTTIKGIEDGARYHHEAFDGSGYPTGLVGKSIPEYARIICIADSFDAMNSDRCYRKKLSKDAIIRELERCEGTQFDKEILQYLYQMMAEGFEVDERM